MRHISLQLYDALLRRPYRDDAGKGAWGIDLRRAMIEGCSRKETVALSPGAALIWQCRRRIAAVEQSVAGGVCLPFLADDLLVDFDDDRSKAGFRVLAELASSTQILFITHHPHLALIAQSVVGADIHSECTMA